MSSHANNPFSAVDASLGYLYQVRLSLLWALRRIKFNPDFLISLETLDDVTFETVGNVATDLLQTKHHLRSKPSVTDASPELWKTLRVWFEGNANGTIPSSAFLHLVTTGAIPPQSAASFLSYAGRDITRARQALDVTAQSSTNVTNKAAYAAYLAASSAGRSRLLERVTIIDNAPTIVELDADLKMEILWAAEREHLVAFLDRLEGWWMHRILAQLTSSPKDRVASAELESAMASLREQFKQDSLPIDDDILDFVLDDEAETGYHSFTFVKQLRLADAGKRRVAIAIHNYYRAFEQRSRWLRDDLVGSFDVDKYEKRLVEEWEVVFAAMRDELGDGASEKVKQQAARSVLAWAECKSFPIRPNVTEPFISRGSFHMLADKRRVGWHPEFNERLSEILTQKAGIL
ncbi:MAG: hypothetical protein HKL96_14010 [Phycisphaerales bacterium]|nr:hypothetical protein [Phycisphaerales bacterium]